MLLLTFNFRMLIRLGYAACLLLRTTRNSKEKRIKFTAILKNKLSSLINIKSNFQCMLEPMYMWACVHAGEVQKQDFKTPVYIWHCWKNIMKFWSKMKKKNPSKKINNFYVKSTHVQNERSREDEKYFFVCSPLLKLPARRGWKAKKEISFFNYYLCSREMLKSKTK